MPLCQTAQAGTFQPNRPISRLLEWISASRSHRVICLLAGVWLISIFDLALTLISHQQGILHEQNPVARRLILAGGPSIFMFKISLIVIGSYPLLKYRTSRTAELAALIVLSAYVVLALHWDLYYQLHTIAATNDITSAELETLFGAIR